MRILQVQGYTTGGSAEHTLQLSRGLRLRGHDVTVACMAGNPGYIERLREAGAETVELPLAGRADFRSIAGIAHLLRKGGFSVVHTHCRNADFAALAAACLPGCHVRRVATIHGLITASGASPKSVNERAHRLILRHGTERIIAISQFVRHHLETVLRIPPTRLHCVYNGTDLPEPTSNRAVKAPEWFEPGSPCVITYGALTPQKDFETFVRAAAVIAQRVPQACFVICGEGPERQRLESAASALGLKGKLVFAGYRADLRLLLDQFATVVVSTAHHEGFGRVASEAMAAGRPVVATNSGAFPEIVTHGTTGYLFEPHNVSELANRVSSLLLNQEQARAMGQAGRLRFEQSFQVSRFLENTIPLLENW